MNDLKRTEHPDVSIESRAQALASTRAGVKIDSGAAPNEVLASKGATPNPVVAMNALHGIRVVLNTTSQGWSNTADALFLGIHGKDGGREFRLNEDPSTAIAHNNTHYVLALGSPCHANGTEQQVQYSTGLGDNDPLLNQVDQDSIEYVYLRKETAESTTANDDVLALEYASVLLCNQAGAIRFFEKSGEINFSDETGLQHWLRPAPYNPVVKLKIVASIYDEFISNSVNLTHGVAQVLEAQQGGTLQSLKVHLGRWNIPSITPRVYLWKTLGGIPVSSPTTTLVSSLVYGFQIGQPLNAPVSSWATIPASGATLVKGEKYAIGVVAGGTQSQKPGTRGLHVYGQSGNPIPSGGMFDFSGPNAMSNGHDFGAFTAKTGNDDMACSLQF